MIMCDIYVVTGTFCCFYLFFYVSCNFVLRAAARLGQDTTTREIF